MCVSCFGATHCRALDAALPLLLDMTRRITTRIRVMLVSLSEEVLHIILLYLYFFSDVTTVFLRRYFVLDLFLLTDIYMYATRSVRALS